MLHCKLDFEVEPVAQALQIAAHTKPDLIVMGAKKGLAGNVPDTKTYRVVCGALCRVPTVRS